MGGGVGSEEERTRADVENGVDDEANRRIGRLRGLELCGLSDDLCGIWEVERRRHACALENMVRRKKRPDHPSARTTDSQPGRDSDKRPP
jgi:hypothetical protein